MERLSNAQSQNDNVAIEDQNQLNEPLQPEISLQPTAHQSEYSTDDANQPSLAAHPLYPDEYPYFENSQPSGSSSREHKTKRKLIDLNETPNNTDEEDN